MKYYDTKFSEFKMRATIREDAKLVLHYINAIAEYEEMSNVVEATLEDIEKNIFDNNRAEVLIAEVNGKPIGFALYFFNFSTFVGKPGVYLEDLFIDKEYRGRGYGKEIFKVLAKVAKENDCGRMEWVCLDWNEPSLKFYNSLGAEQKNEWIIHRLHKNGIDNLAN